MPPDVEEDLWSMFEDSGKARDTLGSKAILFEELEPFWEAFTVLNQSRPPGFSGISPIPLSEVAAYCDLFGFSKPRARAEMVREVRRIDRVFIHVQASHRKDLENVTARMMGGTQENELGPGVKHGQAVRGRSKANR